MLPPAEQENKTRQPCLCNTGITTNELLKPESAPQGLGFMLYLLSCVSEEEQEEQRGEKEEGEEEEEEEEEKEEEESRNHCIDR